MDSARARPRSTLLHTRWMAAETRPLGITLAVTSRARIMGRPEASMVDMVAEYWAMADME